MVGLGDIMFDKVSLGNSEGVQGKNYKLGNKGLYLETKNDYFDYVALVEEFSNPLRINGGDIKQKFRVEEKLPMKMLLDVVKFFKDIEDTSGNEAMAFAFYNGEGKDIDPDLLEEYGDAIKVYGNFILLVPVHWVTSVVTSIADGDGNNDRAFELLRSEFTLALRIHSHNSMGAFWSNTDNDNELGMYQCLCMVVGKLNTTHPEYRFRTVFNRKMYHIDSYGSQDIGKKLGKGDVTHNFVEKLEVKSSYLGMDFTRELTLDEALGYINMKEYPSVPEKWFTQIKKRYVRTKKDTKSKAIVDDMNGVRVKGLDPFKFKGNFIRGKQTSTSDLDRGELIDKSNLTEGNLSNDSEVDKDTDDIVGDILNGKNSRYNRRFKGRK